MTGRVEIWKPWAPGWNILKHRDKSAIRSVVVHRIEVSQEDPSFADSAVDVARFFREHPVGKKATGGDMPYPLVIERDGRVVQTLPLTRVSPHAVSHNPTGIGLALIGDFRRAPPEPEQRASLVQLLTSLLAELSLPASAIVGHDELTGGSRDPEKICPGPHLPLGPLRDEVGVRLAENVSRVEVVW